MSERPTPETDEAWKAVSRTTNGFFDSSVPASQFASSMNLHAKKLERERDEAVARAHNFEQGYHIHSARTDEAARQRDEAREVASGLAEQAERLRKERDEAREALREIAETIGGAISENASTEFHAMVADEVRLKILEITRERDEVRAAVKGSVEGFVDGGSTQENYLMVQIPIPPTGYRLGQSVRVILPQKEDAK